MPKSSVKACAQALAFSHAPMAMLKPRGLAVAPEKSLPRRCSHPTSTSQRARQELLATFQLASAL